MISDSFAGTTICRRIVKSCSKEKRRAQYSGSVSTEKRGWKWPAHRSPASEKTGRFGRLRFEVPARTSVPILMAPRKGKAGWNPPKPIMDKFLSLLGEQPVTVDACQ